MIVRLVLLFSLLSPSAFGAATPPEAPRSLPDIRPASALCTIAIANTAALTAYINGTTRTNCATGGNGPPTFGDEVQLASGVTFTGNWLLPVPTGTVANGANENYVTFTTGSGVTIPSAGTRAVDASDNDGATQTLLAPAILKGSTTSAVINVAANGIHHYRFVGFKVTGSNSTSNNGLIQIDTLNDAASRDNPANYPSYISFERMIIDPTYDYGAPTGITCHASHCRVIDSTITNIVRGGTSDVYTVHFGCGAGPYQLQNNSLSASGETFFIGGGPQDGCATITAGFEYQTPADITIHYNKLYMPLSWKPDDPSYVAPASGEIRHKNGGEFKGGERVSIKYNYWKNIWIGSGQVYDLTFTPREYGYSRDIEVAYNYFNTTMGPTFSVGDYEAGPGFGPSPYALSRLWVHHNIWANVKTTAGVSLGSGPFYGGTLGVMSSDFGNLSVVGGTIVASGTTGSVTFTSTNAAFTQAMVTGGLVLIYAPSGVPSGRATLTTFTDSRHVVGTVTSTFGAGATSANAVANWAVGPSAIVGTAAKTADSWVFEHNAEVGTDSQFNTCAIFIGYNAASSTQAKATNFVWRDNICRAFSSTGTSTGGFRGDKDGNTGTAAVDAFTDSATRTWSNNVQIAWDTLTGNAVATNTYTGTLLACTGSKVSTPFATTCKTAFHDPDETGSNAGGDVGFVDAAGGDFHLTGAYATAAHDGTMIGPDLRAVDRYADYAWLGIPYNSGATGATAVSGSSGAHAVSGSSGATATQGCIRGPIAVMDSGC